MSFASVVKRYSCSVSHLSPPRKGWARRSLLSAFVGGCCKSKCITCTVFRSGFPYKPDHSSIYSMNLVVLMLTVLCFLFACIIFLSDLIPQSGNLKIFFGARILHLTESRSDLKSFGESICITFCTDLVLLVRVFCSPVD
jgi:hypothetical protein